MKKIIICLAFLLLNSLCANSFELNDYWQIRHTLRDYNKALAYQDVEKIKTFYSENYKNADGFTLSELAQMLEKTYNSYDKMKQKTKINSIVTFDDDAIVQLTDTTSALVHLDKAKEKEKAGKLEGKSVYTLYLRKTNEGWKIFYDEITAETTSLKYGIANKIPMKLNTPLLIKKGEQYDLNFEMQKPDDIVAVASISNEEIKYPTPEYKEVFRKIPSTGRLERVVKANQNKKNEYAIASVALTKFSVNEKATKARIEVIGMAYLMKRVNMTKLKDESEK